ncbi:MAG: HAMP domain-containing sensor histidine kinase [Flavobacteriales bacterium]
MEIKARELHRKLFIPIIIYSICYTILDLFLGMKQHALITVSLIPIVIISYWLDRLDKVRVAKVWTFVSMNFLLLTIALVSVQDSFVFLFYFPLAIGSFIIFNGNDRFYSYLFTALSLLGMMVVVLIDLKKWFVVQIEVVDPLVEKELNIIGAFLFIIIQIIFLIRLNESIQGDMIRNKVALDSSNMRLKSSVYARDQILSMIAHDIRSPLASIYGFLDLLDSKTLQPEEIRQLKKSIKEKSDATIQMVNDVLKWSMTENAIITFRPVEMDADAVESLVKTVCIPYEDLVSRGEIDCKIDVKWQGFVTIDRVMMEAILRNLLSNAIKFTNSNRKIQTSLKAIGRELCFSIRDNGSGIAPENLEKLRQGIAFTTNDDRNPKGVGLGNQIVIDFLNKHSAKLSVESELGKGSEFKFCLPLVAGSAS